MHLKATKINKKRTGLAHSKAATANHKFSPTRELELSLWGWHRDYFAWIQLLCLFWINNSFTCLVLNQTNQTGGQQHIDTYLMASVLCLQLPISHPLCPPPGGTHPIFVPVYVWRVRPPEILLMSKYGDHDKVQQKQRYRRQWSEICLLLFPLLRKNQDSITTTSSMSFQQLLGWLDRYVSCVCLSVIKEIWSQLFERIFHIY